MQAAPRPASLSKQGVFAAVLGNALEFYDFGVYAAYAVMIGHVFFPFGSNFKSLLLSVATFGVGFISRPLGGFLLGAYADLRGRKSAMTLTIALMAISTTAIGLLPSYAEIGMAAPVLLVLARLVQGFSTGGELGVSTIFLFEAAPAGRKALITSWQLASQGISVICVGLIGFLLARTLSHAALFSWGWRIPFLFGILIAPVGIVIRNRLEETLDTRKAHTTTSAVFTDLLHGHWAALLLNIAIFAGVTITQYFLVYMTTFALTALHMPATTAMLAGFVIGVVIFVFALTGGWLGDRYGAKAIMILPRLVLIVALYPAMLFVIEAHTRGALLGTVAFLAVLQAVSSAVLVLLIPYSFPAEIRATGLAVAFGVGAAVFGGTAQVLFTGLIAVTHNPLSPIWYVIVMNLASVAAMLLLYRMPRRDALPEPRGAAIFFK